MKLLKDIESLRDARTGEPDTRAGRTHEARLSERVLLTAAVDAKRVFELTQRVEDLERQVVALSRAPLALSQQVADLKQELKHARLGAKGVLTEGEIMKRANAKYSKGKHACDAMNRSHIEAHKRKHDRDDE